MKKLLKPLLLVAGLLLLAFIFLSLDLQKIIAILGNADLFFLGLAILATCATLLGKGIKWRQLLFEQKEKMSTRESVTIFLKGFFLSTVTPGRVGDLGRAFYIKEKTGLIPALAGVLLDRILDVLTLLFFALVMLIAFFWIYGSWVVNPLIILILLLLCLAGVWYILQNQHRGFFRGILFALTPEKYREKIRPAYSDLSLALQESPRHKKEISLAILIGIIDWIFVVLTALFLGAALGIHQPIYFFAIVISILVLMDIIPLIGTREAAAIILFSSATIQAELAVAFSLSFFVVGYIFPAIVGGILFLKDPISM